MHAHIMTSPADVLAFALAGNARLTIVSKATGNRFSYRLRATDDGKGFFVGVMTGTDNENAYTYLGFIRDRQFRRTAKSRITEDAPSHKAFAFFWRHLCERNHVHEGLEVWHEGHCGRCGRTLTVPESIERGIGPECVKHMGLDMDEPSLAQWARKKGQEWGNNERKV